MKSFFRLLLLGALCFLAKTNTIHAQCSPDVTAPVALCDQAVNVSLGLGCTATLNAQIFDDGSYDDCTSSLIFRAEVGAPSATPPTSTEAVYNGIGTYNTTLWVGDSSGNWNTCMVAVSVEDKLDPIAICETLVTASVTPGTLTNVSASAFDDGSFDNCGTPNLFIHFGNTPASSPPTQNAFDLDTAFIGTHDVVLWVGDNASPTNWSTCISTMEVDSGNCQPGNILACNSLLNVALAPNGTATISPSEILEGGPYCQNNWTYLIEEVVNTPPTPLNPAATLTFDTSDIGTNQVVVYSYEGSNSTFTSACWANVEVSNPFGCAGTDNTPPVAICEVAINTVLDANGTVTVFPTDLDDGSYDNCTTQTDLDFRIEKGVSSATVAPSTTSVTYDSLDNYFATLWIGDEAGNWNKCITEVNVDDCIAANALSCNDHVFVSLDPSGTAVIDYDALLEGGPYCPNSWNYTVELGPNPFPNPNGTATVTLDATMIGDTVMYAVYGYAPGSSTNPLSCWGHIEVFGMLGCVGDVLAPIVLSPADMTVSATAFNAVDLQDAAAVNAAFGTATATDNCGILSVTSTFSITTTPCGTGSATRTIVALDSAFNQATAVQIIDFVNDPYSISIPNDFAPGDSVLDSIIITHDNGNLGVNISDVVFDYDCDGNPDEIIRTWAIIDWCNFSPGNPLVLIPRLDWDGDSVDGDAYDITSNSTDLIATQGNPPFSVGAQSGYYEYEQHILYNNLNTITHTLTGSVFHDANLNCTNDAEVGLANWTVVTVGAPSGETRSAVTDSLGNYSVDVCLGDTLIDVSLNVPYNYGGATCQTTYSIPFTAASTSNATESQDIGVQLDSQCPLMVIDMASPKIRPCFAGNYVVSYANISNQTIVAPYVEVSLDPALNFTSANIPQTALGANVYRFDLNDLTAGASGQFKINFFTDCATPPGMTHCSEAHIFPDTICPQSPLWSGANIEVAGNCVNDSVYFTITNTGLGNSQQLDFVVVEDVIMRESGSFTLNPGGIFNVMPYKANGATFRVEADQEPGHPYGGMPSAAVEGCDGFTAGMVTLFPTGNSNPFITHVCQENVSSFDPNDKQANPVGFGSEHFIEPNTDIEYTIRFQNTGTDTAFNVVLLDTLSANLNATSVRALAASHDYRFERISDNVLRFSFDNIMLPDSNVNEPLSNGFVKFRVAQIADLEDFTRIENKAAIYFDFNDPIITNTAFHTVKENFLTVSSVQTFGAATKLDVYPNPATDFMYFDGDVPAVEGQRFVLTDMQGKAVRTATIDAWPYRFERKGLADGVYFFQIQNATQGLLYTGKVLLK